AFPDKIYYVFENAKNIGDMVVGLANLKYVDPNKVLIILEKQLAKHMAHWEAIISFDREKYMVGEIEGLRGLLGDFTEDLHQHTTTYLNRIIQYVKEYNN
ncbi:MAG: PadR family transcriptional regulator, partial [Lysinibacillus sp.]